MEQIRNAFAFVEDVAAISIEPVQQATSEPVRLQSQPLPQPQKGMRAASRGTIRVSISKVDYLIDLVGELVIAHSMKGQIMNGFTQDRHSSRQP